MTGLEIVLGDIADVPTIMPIMDVAFDPAYGEAWRQDQCSTILSLPYTALFVAKLQGKPCGFALVRWVLEEMEILLIAVDPLVQHNGVGQAMLNAITDLATSIEIATIFLEVREDNPAISFYTAAKFTQIGYRPTYYSGKNGVKRSACTFAKTLRG